VEDLSNPTFLWLSGESAKDLDSLLELLVAFSLMFGLAIYAWLIATSLDLRRWLGFLIGFQVILFVVDLGCFRLPGLTQFVAVKIFTVYAIILSTAKAIWFLWPQRVGF
jgi:hypothetical protein